MKRIIHGIIIIMLLCGCSEPFEIQQTRTLLDVVDGKISTLEGNSYIRIFQQVDDSTQRPIVDLNISVVDNNDDTFSFIYLSNGVYIPQDPSFRGVEGSSYRMVASNEVIAIQSSSDIMPAAIPLSMATVDTFLSILTPLNLIQKVDAVGAIALIPSQSGGSYARLRFEFAYQNPLIGEVETTMFKDQYALFSCETGNSCNADSTRLPVGLTNQQVWRFLNSKNPDCLNIDGEVDTSNGCIPPCCLFQEDWNAEFKIILESMSASSFEYWKQVQQLTNNNGLIFDTFPFPISGNVSCEGCQNEIVGQFRTVAETFATENKIL